MKKQNLLIVNSGYLGDNEPETERSGFVLVGDVWRKRKTITPDIETLDEIENEIEPLLPTQLEPKKVKNDEPFKRTYSDDDIEPLLPAGTKLCDGCDN